MLPESYYSTKPIDDKDTIMNLMVKTEVEKEEYSKKP